MRRGRLLAIWGAAALLLAACGPAATATPVPATPTPVPATPTTQLTGLTPTPATPTPKPTAAPTAAPEARPKYGGVAKAALTEDMPGWDTFRTGTGVAIEIWNILHAHLLNNNDKPPGCAMTPYVPGLAASWKWLDDVTLQFKLRQGVKFPNQAPFNGREFTAQDVVYTVQEQWPAVPLLSAPIKDQLKGVKAIDKYTVNMELNRPYSPFLDRVPAEKRSVIVGPELYSGKKQLTRPEEHVGLGPFLVADSKPGVSLSLRKNENYFLEGRPYVDGLHLSVILDISTVTAALRSGKLDLLWIRGGIPMTDQLVRVPGLKSQVCRHTAPQFVYLRNDKPPFNDVRVRRAMSMAIDREALLKTAYLGMSEWYYSSVTNTLPDFMLKLADYPAETQRYLQYNPTEAKRLLAEAGYPQGFDFKLTVTARAADPLQMDIAEFLTASFSQIGLRPSLQVLERGLFLRTVYTERSYSDAAVGFGSTGSTIDELIYDSFHSKSEVRNRAYIKDPVLDELIERSWVTTDPAKYKEIVRQHQLRAAEQTYMISLPQGLLSVFWWPHVKNVAYGGVTNDIVPWIRHIWLDR